MICAPKIYLCTRFHPLTHAGTFGSSFFTPIRADCHSTRSLPQTHKHAVILFLVKKEKKEGKKPLTPFPCTFISASLHFLSPFQQTSPKELFELLSPLSSFLISLTSFYLHQNHSYQSHKRPFSLINSMVSFLSSYYLSQIINPITPKYLSDFPNTTLTRFSFYLF